MKKYRTSILSKLLVIFIIFPVCSCQKFKEYNQKPELESLQQAIKTSAALGYCTSIVMSAIEGRDLPGNVIYE